MSEYRDALHAAKRRIAQLEEELDALPPKRRRISPFIGLALGGVVTAVAIVAWSAATRAGEETRVRPIDPPPSPVPVPIVTAPRPTVQLDVRMGRDPLVIDTNEDGTDEVIVPTWRSQDKSLYVVALDGRSFTSKWSAGPFPSEWSSDAVNLALSGDLVVASDSFGGIHAIDRKTGAVRGEQKLADPVHSLCTTVADGGAKLVVGEGPMRCPSSALPYCPRSPGTFPCLSYAHVRGKGTIDPFLTYEDSDVIVTTGHAPLPAPAPRERPAPYAVAQDRTTKKVLWEGKLSIADEKVHVGIDRMVYADHRLFDVYMALGGEVRIAARDVRTGTDAWARTLPGTRDGSRILSLLVTGARLYTTIDSQLFVIDARTGSVLHAASVIQL